MKARRWAYIFGFGAAIAFVGMIIVTPESTAPTRTIPIEETILTWTTAGLVLACFISIGAYVNSLKKRIQELEGPSLHQSQPTASNQQLAVAICSFCQTKIKTDEQYCSKCGLCRSGRT